MPNTKSAIKRVRQNNKKRERNKAIRTKIKNIEKAARDESDSKEAEELLKKAYSIYDKAVKKGVIHKNKAARKKSQINRIVREK